MRVLSAMVLVLVGLAPCRVEASEYRSPRIEALAGEVEKGKSKAVDQFWKEMEAKGAPLVEAIEGDPNHVLMTMVWRGDADTENVRLVGGAARGESFEKNMLEQLGDSDVWYKTYWTRNDLRGTYRFSPNDPLKFVPMDDAEAVRAQRKNYRRDPLNPGRGGKSLVELANAPVQKWIVLNEDAAEGELIRESGFKSEILGNERGIGVYLPPGYDASGEAYPLFMVFDLTTYVSVVPTPRIMNNLIHEKKIDPAVVVFVGNAAGARNDELPCNEKFADFLAMELMPWVNDNYNVSTDPSKNVIAGSSFGGLASSFFAFRHPELFGNVISQSGSYWWSPETNTIDLAHEVEGEWLTREFAKAEKKGIRFFIESGLNEGGAPSMVITNRHFRDVLIAKGYEIVKYDEFNGGHDYLNWRGSLGEGFIALVGK